MQNINLNAVRISAIWSFMLTTMDWFIHWMTPNPDYYNAFVANHAGDPLGFFICIIAIVFVSSITNSSSVYVNYVVKVSVIVFVLGIAITFIEGERFSLPIVFILTVIVSTLWALVIVFSKVFIRR